MYCSAHIRQLLPRLFEDRFDEEYWHRQYPGRLPAILRAREQCRDADLFLIEVATLKYFRDEDGYYLNNEFLKCDRHLSGSVLTADEFEENLRSIHAFLRARGKQAVFVSHFNPDGIPQREMIIRTMARTGLSFYDPTPLVLAHLPCALSDQNHYHHDFESIVMNDLGSGIDTIQI